MAKGHRKRNGLPLWSIPCPLMAGVLLAVDRDILPALLNLLPLGIEYLNRIHIGCDRALVERVLCAAAVWFAVVADELVARAGEEVSVVDGFPHCDVVGRNLTIYVVVFSVIYQMVSICSVVSVKNDDMASIV